MAEGLSFPVTCDRCLVHLTTTKTREEVLGLGWKPKHADAQPGYGWECPACIGQPPIVRARGKRSGRR